MDWLSAVTARVKQEVSSKDVHLWVALGRSYVTVDAIAVGFLVVRSRNVIRQESFVLNHDSLRDRLHLRTQGDPIGLSGLPLRINASGSPLHGH